MSPEYKVLAGKVFEALNTRNMDLLDEVYTPDAKMHVAGRDLDRAGYKAMLSNVLNGLPDARTQEIESFSEGDSFCSRFTLTGTLTAPQSIWPVESKGQAVDVLYVATGHLREGMIDELWLVNDRLAMMQQLGAIPS